MNRVMATGSNKTGLDMSPEDSKLLIEGAESALPSSDGNEMTLASYREPEILAADPVGSVPPPGTLTGVAKTGMQKLLGNQPEVLLDKLAGRLAFERTGTRLYDAMLAKCSVRRDEVDGISVEQFLRFRNEEANHFALLWEAMRELGADPTAQTPEADVNGVASMGLLQIITDPRTSVAQCIHAIHIAELTDRDGWDLLIKLAREMGQTGMAENFTGALADEEQHLETIRQLMEQTVLTEAGR
jgi:rubrerythrin